MSKTIRKIKSDDVGIQCFHVISEPGDATRYDYCVIVSHGVYYSFAPVESNFRFPQKLYYYDVSAYFEQCKDPGYPWKPSENMGELARDNGCNVFTLAECIRTIYELNLAEQTRRAAL